MKYGKVLRGKVWRDVVELGTGVSESRVVEM